MDVSSSFSAEIGQRVVVEIDIGSRIAKSERAVGGARALLRFECTPLAWR